MELGKSSLTPLLVLTSLARPPSRHTNQYFYKRLNVRDKITVVRSFSNSKTKIFNLRIVNFFDRASDTNDKKITEFYS